MLIALIAILFFAFVVPIGCFVTLAREDVHPTIHALALAIFAPFVVFLIRVLRLHL